MILSNVAFRLVRSHRRAVDSWFESRMLPDKKNQEKSDKNRNRTRIRLEEFLKAYKPGLHKIEQNPPF